MNDSTHHTHDHDLDSFSHHLRSRLDGVVGDLPDAAGPAAAASRARARRRNRRTVLSAAAALAVVAASTQALTGGTGGSDVATASQAAVVDEALGFDWTVTDDGLSYAQNVSVGDSGLYVLSTAPGTPMEDYPQGDAPRAMYRLAEDGTWTPITLEGDDPNLGTVSERGSTLYALSTGAATGPGGKPIGSVSTDGGDTWSSVPLEEPSPPSDDVAWTVSYRLDIASTAHSTLALVSADIGLPVEDLFPEISADDGEAYSHEIADEGVHLVRHVEGQAVGETGAPDPESEETTEVVRTVSWSDLGIDGPGDLAPQRWAYLADGDSWNEVPSPVTSESVHGASVELNTVSDSFLLSVVEFDIGVDETKTSAFRSLDGQEWSPVAQPGTGEILATDDALLHVDNGPHQGDSVQVSRDGGATWTPLDLASLDPTIADLPDDSYISGAAGPLGVALVIGQSPGHGSDAKLLFSSDLERWSVTDLGDVAPDTSWFGEVIVGTDRVVLLGHSDAGEPGSPERSLTLSGVPRRS